MNSRNHYVMKFGGSCLSSAGDMIQAASIVTKYTDCVVVASAMKGVTEKLLELTNTLQKESLHAKVEELRMYHLAALSGIRDMDTRSDAVKELNYFFQILSEVILDTDGPRNSSERAHILSFGERLSANILRWYLKDTGIKAVTVNSDEIIFSQDDNYLDAEVDEEISISEIRGRISFHSDLSEIPVITGYFCSSLSGMTALLGRNSSDYTAALVAYALPSYELVFWKDVPGLMTGDPKLVKESHVLKLLTYDQTEKYIENGARILHPKVISLARRKGTTIRIRDFRNEESEGTLITDCVPSVEFM